MSYNKKHNHVNNEESGEDNNISWNCGEENDEGAWPCLAYFDTVQPNLRPVIVAVGSVIWVSTQRGIIFKLVTDPPVSS